jgi:hypothetical protein
VAVRGAASHVAGVGADHGHQAEKRYRIAPVCRV